MIDNHIYYFILVVNPEIDLCQTSSHKAFEISQPKKISLII